MSIKEKRRRKAEEKARKAAVAKTTMRVLGIGIISTAILVLATKRVFDEIFVEDDWSDMDWGDEDIDFGMDID